MSIVAAAAVASASRRAFATAAALASSSSSSQRPALLNLASIEVPADVSVSRKGSELTVSGPLGTSKTDLASLDGRGDGALKLSQDGRSIEVASVSKPFFGTLQSLLKNKIEVRREREREEERKRRRELIEILNCCSLTSFSQPRPLSPLNPDLSLLSTPTSLSPLHPTTLNNHRASPRASTSSSASSASATAPPCPLTAPR